MTDDSLYHADTVIFFAGPPNRFWLQMASMDAIAQADLINAQSAMVPETPAQSPDAHSRSESVIQASPHSFRIQGMLLQLW